MPPTSIIPIGESPLSQPSLLVLPVLTLCLAGCAYIVRMLRAGVIESMSSDYVQAARLNGINERRVIFRHALRNSLAPTVQVVALTVQWLIGGIVVVETVFSYPGLGAGLVGAVTGRDIPVVQSVTLILAVVYIVINLVADLRRRAARAEAADERQLDGCRRSTGAAARALRPPSRRARRERLGLAQRRARGHRHRGVRPLLRARTRRPGCSGAPYQTPSSTYLLGTDYIGEDVFSRLLWGGRTVIAFGFIATALAYLVGGTIGLFAGFRRGLADSILMRCMDVLLAFPPIIFLLMLGAGFGNSLTALVLGIATVHIPSIARIVRTAALETSVRGYVEAAMARGDSTVRDPAPRGAAEHHGHRGRRRRPSLHGLGPARCRRQLPRASASRRPTRTGR